MSVDDKFIKEVAEPIEELFLYMRKHHLNIRSEKDVTKAMKALGREDISKEGVKVTVPVLGIIQRMVGEEFAKARKTASN